MTYKTRYEVLDAAAMWMRICEKAGVGAMLKWNGAVKQIRVCTLNEPPHEYEFPLALLEGKEVWVGSELYYKDCGRITIQNKEQFLSMNKSQMSWNPPKPKDCDG